MGGVPVTDPPERRRRERRSPLPGDALARMRMRAGPELRVVNVSDVGALVQGTTRLLPGTRIDVHLIGRNGRVLVRSRVVRAYVWQLCGDRIEYRAALAFEQPVDTSEAAPPTLDRAIAEADLEVRLVREHHAP